jgi:transposase InsO family protein
VSTELLTEPRCQRDPDHRQRNAVHFHEIPLETLNRLGITHRRTAYNHPEGNSYIERFHRSLKEEEVWTAEYRNVQEARALIARWIQEYNHDRPHRGVGNRTPHEAFLSFEVDLRNEALTV